MASCIIDWSHSLGHAVDLPKQGGPTERAAKLLLRGQKIVDWRCCLRRRMSPLVAPLRHADPYDQCRLSGVKRKWRGHRRTVAFDPGRVKTRLRIPKLLSTNSD